MSHGLRGLPQLSDLDLSSHLTQQEDMIQQPVLNDVFFLVNDSKLADRSDIFWEFAKWNIRFSLGYTKLIEVAVKLLHHEGYLIFKCRSLSSSCRTIHLMLKCWKVLVSSNNVHPPKLTLCP